MATKKKIVAKKVKKPIVKKSIAARRGSSFWRIEFNVNTVYWLVIGLAIIATATWTYNTNQQISDIYDSIDQTNSVNDDVVSPTHKATNPSY